MVLLPILLMLFFQLLQQIGEQLLILVLEMLKPEVTCFIMAH